MSQAVSMPTPPPLRNDGSVGEQYVDGPVGVDFLNGNLHIDFAALCTDHTVNPPPQYRQMSLGLVIPLAGAIDLQNTIARLIQALHAQGVVQPVMPGPQTRQLRMQEPLRLLPYPDLHDHPPLAQHRERALQPGHGPAQQRPGRRI